MLRLWRSCRGGMGGLAHLPDSDGINDQSAWLMQAFEILEAAEAAAEKREGAA